MSDECIHGLEGGLCAICFPKAIAEVSPAAPVARASRAKAATRAPSLRSSPSPRTVTLSAPKPVRSTRSASAKSAVDSVAEQRIYHVTHIRNLPGILASGCLLADASDAWTSRPTVDISSAENREARRSTSVDGGNGSSVAAYVPFFLSPNARLWDGLLAAAVDPRLSADAHGADVYDFVILVSTVKKVRTIAVADGAAVDGAAPAAAVAVAVTDGDAAGAGTRIEAAPEASDGLLRVLRAEPEAEAIRRAELLVAEAFPFELITLVGVANDKVRDVVRGILADTAHQPKVAVYPPWFHTAE